MLFIALCYFAISFSTYAMLFLLFLLFAISNCQLRGRADGSSHSTISVLFLLWRIRKHFTGRAKTTQKNVAIITLGTTKQIISAMKIIHYSPHTVICIKPIMKQTVCLNYHHLARGHD